MADFTSHFNKLEDDVEAALEQLEKSIGRSNGELQDIINEFYYSLEKSGNSIKTSVSNLKKINQFKSKINYTLENGEYSQGVKDYLGNFTNNSSVINEYFSSMAVSFKSNDSLYKAILESNISTTTDSLLGSGVNANFTDPLIKILRDNITSGSDKISFTKSINESLFGENSKLARYSKQVASDSITQFNSNYINTISSDLGLKHYYYKGTKIKDSREFCKKIAGKYFTETSLKSYVQQQMSLNGGKGWDGMVKGENWTNFPIYRGGYACRHYLIPVSEAVYNASSLSQRWA